MSGRILTGQAGMCAGVDEAGRGPLAGPVVAAAVILPEKLSDILANGLDDSKKLSAKKRAALEIAIRQEAQFGIGLSDVEEIDAMNILQATMAAMTRAVEALPVRPDFVRVDGNRMPKWGYRAEAVIGGDALHAEISAASILAKEYRDRIMAKAAEQYPQYGWARNKGYGTKEHMAALRTYGATLYHRKSFAPVAQLSLL